MSHIGKTHEDLESKMDTMAVKVVNERTEKNRFKADALEFAEELIELNEYFPCIDKDILKKAEQFAEENGYKQDPEDIRQNQIDNGGEHEIYME